MHAANPLISHVLAIKRRGCKACATRRDGKKSRRNEGRERKDEAERRAKSPNDWHYILHRDRSLPRLGDVNFSVLHTSPPIPGATLYLSSIAFHPSHAAGKSLWERSYWWGARRWVLWRWEKLTIGCAIVGERRGCLGIEGVIYVIISADLHTHIYTNAYIILDLWQTFREINISSRILYFAQPLASLVHQK